jgi:hypothetical protein
MEKHELELVLSTCTLSCNVLLHDCTRHTRTLPLLTYLEVAARQTSVFYAPLLKRLLGLRNARWVGVHEVNVRLSLGKLVPIGRHQEVL